jgi:hypothetical protein
MSRFNELPLLVLIAVLALYALLVSVIRMKILEKGEACHRRTVRTQLKKVHVGYSLNVRASLRCILPRGSATRWKVHRTICFLVRDLTVVLQESNNSRSLGSVWGPRAMTFFEKKCLHMLRVNRIFLGKCIQLLLLYYWYPLMHLMRLPSVKNIQEGVALPLA